MTPFLRALCIVMMLSLTAVAGCIPSKRDTSGLNAQEEDTDPDKSDANPDNLSDLQPLFSRNSIGEPEGFYNYPFPNNTRLLDNGAPNLSNFYAAEPQEVLDLFIESIHRDNRGFSPLSSIYFRFDGPIDPQQLPPNPTDTLSEDSPVYLLNVDPNSPGYGERTPVQVEMRTEAGTFWLPNTLVLSPLQGWPMRSGTTYAAVVESSLKDLDQKPLSKPETWTSLLAETSPLGREEEWSALQPLIDHMGLDNVKNNVLVATVFTTSDHPGEMVQMRQWIHNHEEPPEPEQWSLEENLSPNGLTVYRGTFEGLNFFTGEAPYKTNGEGVLQFEANGDPVPQGTETFEFYLSVPNGDMPPEGWPLAIYGHGSGGSARSFIEPEAEWAAQEGVAMISIDQPLQGSRSAGVNDFVAHLVELALINPGSGRDLYRHAVPDMFQLIRMADETLTVPENISHTGEKISFNTNNLIYTGHSQGSQTAGLLLGTEPLIHSAFLSAGGGGVATAFLKRKANNIDIEQLVALLLNINRNTEPLSPSHPVVGLLIQPLFDASDPLHYAINAIEEPREGHNPVHIFMTEGLEDTQTLPDTIEALAASYGLPIAGDVGRPSAIHETRGISSVPLPLSSNVEGSTGNATGALLQFPNQGHFPLYRVEQARVWFREWLRTSKNGAPPTISAP